MIRKDHSQLSNVRLLPGNIFYESQQIGLDYLLRLDINRLLVPLYEGALKPTQYESYGGWESMEIKGHSVGHYLSALASMFAATKNSELKYRLDKIVEEMAMLQREDGYLGGFKSTPFDVTFTGEFEVEHFTLSGHWVPWYSIHKIYAGLLDAYELGESEVAFEVVKKMADWAVEGTKDMTDDQFQKMLICEFGGMNEVMASLYELTSDKRYLSLAKRFSQPFIIEPLMKGLDDLQGKHANTQIPKVIGAAKLYEVTKDESYFNAAKFFFDTVTQKRSFIIGGNSNSEHFGLAETEVLTRDTAETCNTYNMMKLAEYLFKWTKESTYIDYYEKALYNHILASQDPDSGGKIYFTSLYPGHFKVYGTLEDSFWCCTGTGMENPGRYNRQIFYKDETSVYINLFISSTLLIEEENINISILTDFPYSNEVQVTIDEAPDYPFELKIRIPAWAKQDMSVVYKNNAYPLDESGYVSIKDCFEKGAKVQIVFNLKLHEYISMDDAHKIAILYGPIVLAAQLGCEAFPQTDTVPNHLSLMNHSKIEVKPLISEAEDITQEFELLDLNSLTFKRSVGGEELLLKPFYATHHERYTVYLKKYTQKEYEEIEEELIDRDQLLFDKTIDVVKTGQQQSEIEHNFRGVNSFAGYLYDVDMWWRDAHGLDGEIEYDLEVKMGIENGLMVSYYGLNGPSYDGVDRSFDIYINDFFFKHVSLVGNGEASIIDMVDSISPEWLTKAAEDEKGKMFITVKFKNTLQHTIVGGILEVRTIVI